MTDLRWHRRNIDEYLSLEIEKRYACKKVIAEILAARNINDPEEMQFFLRKEFSNHHNPFLFEDMEKAVACIFKAVKEKRKVLVYGDRDVDGITSTVLMVELLESLGLEVQWKVPSGDSPYGFTTEIVSLFAEEGGGLLVAVDCGSTSIEEIRMARDLKIDAIIVDHHDLREELPAANAIINPKISDSSYPFESLCACALVAKVVWALNFAKTDLYNVPVCLCSIRPGNNNTLIIDAIRLMNFVEEARISEALVPEVASYATSRLPDFFLDAHIFVYDASMFNTLFSNIIEDDCIPDVTDIAPILQEAFPTLRGKSLLQIRDQSHSRRYRDELEEIDMLHIMSMHYLECTYPQIPDIFDECLEFVAIATVADMMPLQNENRLFVHHGLEKLNTNIHKGLAALLEASNYMKSHYTADEIGWHITPLINATGRMGRPEIALRLLLKKTPEKERVELALTTVTLNRQRKKICEQAWNTHLEKAKKNLQSLEGKYLWVFDKKLPRGATGLLAGRFAQYFCAPALVLSSTNDGKYVMGSIRSVGFFDATKFLSCFQHIFDGWGGHKAAAGFHFKSERFDEFIQALKDHAAQTSKPAETERSIEIDAELSQDTLKASLYDDLQQLAPFGMGNPPVVFLLRNVLLERIDFIGADEKHLRMSLLYQEVRWGAVYWNAAERLGNDFSVRDTVDIIFHFEKNYFKANEMLRFNVLDLRKVLDEAVLAH